MSDKPNKIKTARGRDETNINKQSRQFPSRHEQQNDTSGGKGRGQGERLRESRVRWGAGGQM